jgi:hypothetical protein
LNDTKPAAEESFLAAPHWVSSYLGIAPYAGYANWLWALILIPLTLWSLMAFVIRWSGEKLSLGELWRRCALPIAVVVSIGHMTKGLVKFNSWAGFLPGALNDPVGLATVEAFSDKTAAQPSALFPPTLVALIGIVLVIAGFLFATREARLVHPTMHRRAIFPLAAFAALFLFVICGIAIQHLG